MSVASCVKRGRAAPPATGRAAGFGLIEVMIALLILSIGLLGIAKTLVLVFADTGIASYRSIAAIQASSLASAMHANKAFWSDGAVPTRIDIARAIVTTEPSSTFATTATDCGQSVCTPLDMAGYDVRNWVNQLNAQLPNLSGRIDCAKPAAGAPAAPTACRITLNWAEKTVNLNASSSNGALPAPTYSVVVEP